MNIRDLMNKLDTINEAGNPDEVIAKYTDKPDLPAFIDSKDGKVKYMDRAGGEMGGAPQAKVMPTDWIKRYAPDLADAIAAKGGNASAYGKQEKKGLFGINGLGSFDQGTTVNTKQAGADATSRTVNAANLTKLNDLVSKLQASLKTPATVKESFSSRRLIESFGYQTESEASLAQQAAVGAGTYGAAKGVGKMLGKAIPGVGLAFGAADAYNRAKKGDWLGAGMAGASGLASLVPGIGTAASLGLDAANLARDYKHGEFGGADAAVPPGGDAKVFAMQNELIKKGAKIKADGKMGPMTQAAMKQYGVTMPAAESAAESIVRLRNRLEMLEAMSTLDKEYFLGSDGNFYRINGDVVTDSTTVKHIWESVKNKPVTLDEGIFGDIVSGAKAIGSDTFNVGKNLFRGASGEANALKSAADLDKWKAAQTAAGASDAQIASRLKNLPNISQATKDSWAAKAFRGGKAIANNPGKAALGAAALGAGAGLALTPGAVAGTPTTPGGHTGAGGTPTTPTTPTTPAVPAGPTPEQLALVDEIKKAMALLPDDGNDETINTALQSAQTAIDSLPKAAPAASKDAHAADMAKAAGYNGPDGTSVGS